MELLILFGVFVIDFLLLFTTYRKYNCDYETRAICTSAPCIHIYIMFQTVIPVLVSFSIFAGLPHVEEK